MAVTPNPDPEWLDTMVKKLIAELERQLKTVCEAQNQDGTPQSRAADARTLSSLERTLERLSRLERERAQVKEKQVNQKTVKEKKIHADGESARAALERRLDKRLAGGTKKSPARKPERG